MIFIAAVVAFFCVYVAYSLQMYWTVVVFTIPLIVGMFAVEHKITDENFRRLTTEEKITADDATSEATDKEDVSTDEDFVRIEQRPAEEKNVVFFPFVVGTE